MIKIRIFPVVAALIFIFSLFFIYSPSVSAAENHGSLIPVDVLDYGTYNDSGRNYGVVTSDGNYQFNYKTPLNFTFWYADLIIEVASGSTPITSLSEISLVGSSGTVAPLTVKHLGDGVFRAYGELPNRFVPTNIGVRVVPSNGLARISIVVDSFLVYTLPGTAVPDIGELNCPQFRNNYTWFSMPEPGSSIGDNFYTLGEPDYTHFNLLSSTNWRSFDYVDFSFRFLTATIDSITVYIASSSDPDHFIYVPFEYQFINGTAIGPNDYCKSGTVVTSASQSFSETERRLNMRLFIPSEYRDYGSLFISITGSYSFEAMASYCFLDNVTGFYNVHDYDPELVKLDQIRIAIENNLSAPPGAADSAANAAGTVSGQQSTVQSGLGELNSIERPEIGNFGGLDFAEIANSNGVRLLNVMLQPIKENPIILGCMIFAAVLAYYSFILFGRK